MPNESTFAPINIDEFIFRAEKDAELAIAAAQTAADENASAWSGYPTTDSAEAFRYASVSEGFANDAVESASAMKEAEDFTEVKKYASETEKARIAAEENSGLAAAATEAYLSSWANPQGLT